MQTESLLIEHTRKWIQTFVIGHNFCPFAKREMEKNSVRFELCEDTNIEAALLVLKKEMQFLDKNPEIETSFLIFPLFLSDFFDYLNFSARAEKALISAGYEGIYQLASFHPNYCFADSNFDDVSNYTNRSPYPMLQLLRETSLEKAIASYGNTGTIPKRNIAHLRALGLAEVEQMFQNCLNLQEEE